MGTSGRRRAWESAIVEGTSDRRSVGSMLVSGAPNAELRFTRCQWAAKLALAAILRRFWRDA